MKPFGQHSSMPIEPEEQCEPSVSQDHDDHQQKINDTLSSALKHSSNTATVLHISTCVYIPDSQWGRTVVFLISTLFWAGTIWLASQPSTYSPHSSTMHPPSIISPSPSSVATGEKSSQRGGWGGHLGFITWCVRIWKVSSDSKS